MPKENIPKTIRINVWKKYNGRSYDGKCFCCSEIISIENFECGHVISEKNGGNVTLDNLRPICLLCNRSMSSKNMPEFQNKYYKNTDEIQKYLKNLTNLQLKLLVKLLGITYDKDVIERIQEKYSLDVIKKYINYEEQFLVKCYHKKCKCLFEIKEKTMNCSCGNHYYYTNNLFNAKTKCEICQNTNIQYMKNLFNIADEKCLINCEDIVNKFNIIDSQILDGKINNEIINKLTLNNILIEILLKINDTIKITETVKYFNIINGKKICDNFRYFEKLKMSIKFLNPQDTLRAIFHMSQKNNIKIHLHFKLDKTSDNIIEYYN